MVRSFRLIAAVGGFAILGLTPALVAASGLSGRYPGAAWEVLSPAQSGWSAPKLRAAEEESRRIGSTAVVIVQHGAVVASWGETSADILLNSARKSLLSALIGIAAANRRIDLDATMARLRIDDNPPVLSEAEKQATVRDLLEARSGIYHPANYETRAMAARRPQRGSHPPGTFWYYNNWDFNTLGTIYEHAAGISVFAAFAQQIASPIGMQDFYPAQCRYSGGANSVYPAYLFYLSARDLARFGLLYLHDGHWRDRQIVPADWVGESTQAYSATASGPAYGYLWWVVSGARPLPGAGLPPGSYFAWGHGGQFLFVIPADDLVVVHLARTSPGRETGTALPQIARLLGLILAATPGG